ncbi:hypothetical protein, partial [Bartonella grahamii]
TPDMFLQSDPAGLLDVSDILEETLKEIPDNQHFSCSLYQQIEERIVYFRHVVSTFKEKTETVTSCTINFPLLARDIALLTEELDKKIQTVESAHTLSWAKCLVETCEAHHHDITYDYDIEKLRKQLNTLATKARQIAFDMKFDFL